MTPGTPSPAVCDRFRGQVSLELDAELSQLERAMLEAHLERCEACSSFRAEAVAVTGVLRASGLEVPGRRPPVRASRRPAAARLQAAAAAAVALAAVGISGQLAAHHAPDARPSSLGSERVVRFPTQDELDQELALIHTARAGEQALRAGTATVR